MNPDTAKWEKIILKKAIDEAKSQVIIALLAADSLGKASLQKDLEKVRKNISNIQRTLHIHLSE